LEARIAAVFAYRAAAKKDRFMLLDIGSY